LTALAAACGYAKFFVFFVSIVVNFTGF